jgi:hypothetical protein
MDSLIRFAHLSPARQSLVRLFQSINYGCVRNLDVRDCEPLLSGPGPIVLVDIRLDSDEPARDELALADFALCAEVRRLMSLLDHVENGTVSRIEVRAGIPRRMTLEKGMKEVGLEQSPAARQAGSKDPVRRWDG